jgi:hypothetical protein
MLDGPQITEPNCENEWCDEEESDDEEERTSSTESEIADLILNDKIYLNKKLSYSRVLCCFLI